MKCFQDLYAPLAVKGTIIQNMFFLKSGTNGCIDLRNNIGLQKKLGKRVYSFKLLLVVILCPETMSP